MRPLTGTLLALIGLTLIGCEGKTGYDASIRRTSYGVAHITADDWGSLGFGEAYAMAEDHVCTISDQMVLARSERSRYFGRGENDRHFMHDVGLAAIGIRERAAADLASHEPYIREYFEGFAAGFNQYLRVTGTDALPGWCAGQPWVNEIQALDIAAYLRSFVMISNGFGRWINAASPPDGRSTAKLSALPEPTGASNGWAFGRDRTESGGGMLLANPHYSWLGSNRFWEKHLTIPGELDMYGVGLIGLPIVLFGFNNNVAWTHTVSSGIRFTLARVDLKPGEPTVYMRDGEEVSMTSRTVAIEVLKNDGTLETVRHTVYETVHGLVISAGAFHWSDEHAYSIRDSNRDNDEVARQWIAMAKAGSMDDFQAAHERYAGMPWVNTIATSSDGRAWFADVSSSPNLSDDAFEEWRTSSLKKPGFIVFDGSDSRFDWIDEPGARDPGLIPYSGMPQLERSDYVFNANDSFWLANSAELLTGYQDFYSLQEGTVRSVRTRMNELMLRTLGEGSIYGTDGKLSLDELTRAAFLNRSLTGELLADAVSERCQARPYGTANDARVELGEACDVLADWDKRFDLESRGAVLWREFMNRVPGNAFRDAGPLFAEAFDPARPVETPSGLAEANGSTDQILNWLAEAVDILQRAGHALDVPLGDLQHSNKNGGRIPVHGGGPREGITNMVGAFGNGTTLEPGPEFKPFVQGSRSLREDGYPVTAGTSFIMALEYGADGPNARALLTYSQSGDPTSEHFTDQTWLFSRKEWRPVLFRERDINSDPNLETYRVSAPRTQERQ